MADGVDEVSAREAVLVAYRDEYKDLADNWRSLDAKAQGALATAGVFLGATFAFVRPEAALPVSERGFLLVGVLALGAAVLLGFMCLSVRVVNAHPGGDAFDERVTAAAAALAGPDSRAAYLTELLERCSEWRETNQEVSEANNDKAAWLKRSQSALSLAVLVFGMLLLFRLFGS